MLSQSPAIPYSVITVKKRGCGYPKEGGFYAIGGGRSMGCFSLPAELITCVCCNHKPKFSRAPVLTSPKYLDQVFAACAENNKCNACIRSTRDYWLSFIGSDYTTESFLGEVETMGLSRRIPPSYIELIKTGDYFACVKGETIIALVPVRSVRYYKKKNDSSDTLSELEAKGIEVCQLVKEE